MVRWFVLALFSLVLASCGSSCPVGSVSNGYGACVVNNGYSSYGSTGYGYGSYGGYNGYPSSYGYSNGYNTGSGGYGYPQQTYSPY
jgi:hypothetical protein